ncbi:hypothetical protein [Saccharopolyspora elongata]|uniref:Uncharacterized protein n=1 Tax=Saccharopolyspora elongata TaxID=2530387 RepID=A0A4R4YHM0_9PSEU|nr:hypothetical protein [Saccharopolyspora elongata]TDD43750.1 hypothetical protein E1288_25540 [Saccharopolyspora elongata]
MNPQPHFMARVRAEFARSEQDKSCHFFPLPADGPLPPMLYAYCGFGILPGEAEALDGPAGMPCLQCLMAAALSDTTA